MGGFRGAGPEVPLHLVIAQAGVRLALLGVDEVRELDAVAQEERRGVIADNVIVAVFGVEAQCETVNVTPSVWGACLTSNGGEACSHRGDGARLEELRLRVLGHVLGDVQLTECSVALRVWNTFGDILAVEVRKLLDEVNVIQDIRALTALRNTHVFRWDGLATELGGLTLARWTFAVRKDVVYVLLCHC